MSIGGLYAIADASWNPYDNLAQLAEQYLAGGARIVQLRMKGQQRGHVIEAAREIMRLKDRWPFTFIVNDYVDVAVEVGADGVHVGSNDAPLAEVRGSIPSDMVVGYSSHSIEEARAAERAGADYVAFGAIYPTPTKGPGHPVQGVEKLGDVVAALTAPVVAIGGITRKNIHSVIKTKVDSIAMITALCKAPSIVDEVRWFVNELTI